MTQLISCPCGNPAYRVSFKPDKTTGRMVTTFHCQVWGKDHEFRTDIKGNIIGEKDDCKFCE